MALAPAIDIYFIWASILEFNIQRDFFYLLTARIEFIDIVYEVLTNLERYLWKKVGNAT